MIFYKGYAGILAVDIKTGMIKGETLDTGEGREFEGKTVEEAIKAFHSAIDDYLIMCEQTGRETVKAFSGKITYRTTPEVHRKISIAAQLESKSINTWIDEKLTRAAIESLST